MIISGVEPLFFFSSRKQHTRYIGDWSSDVCSSDLAWLSDQAAFRRWLHLASHRRWVVYAKRPFGGPAQVIEYRSEERRVGKECSTLCLQGELKRLVGYQLMEGM